MPLTSQIKKLEGFLQKLIKFEPGIIPGRNETRNDGLALLAMRMNFLTKSWARCNNGNECYVLSRTVLNKEKKAV